MIFRTYYKLQHIFIAIIQHLTLHCKLLNKKLFTLHCYFWQIFPFFLRHCRYNSFSGKVDCRRSSPQRNFSARQMAAAMGNNTVDFIPQHSSFTGTELPPGSHTSVTSSDNAALPPRFYTRQ